VSRIALGAVAVILAALAFGLGYFAGLAREEPRGAMVRTRREGAPPPPSQVSAAVEAALMRPDPLERTAELARLLQGLGPDAVGDVRAAYDAVFVDVGDVEIVLLAEWWAQFDPRGAFDWTHREWVGKHPAVVASVIRAWAARDPEEARQAIDEIAKPVLRRGSVEALLRGWEESGEPGLVDYVAGLPFGVARQVAIATLARRKVLRNGSEEAFRWAEGLSDDHPDRFKLQVFRRVASAVAEVDPHAAAAWAEQHSAGEYGDGLFRRVGVRWAKRDGPAAMAWLAALPAGDQRDAGVQETYREWLSRDAEGATAWMRSSELEPWLQPALTLFALYLSGESPEEALDWAARIRDEERRQEAIVRIGRRWVVADPDAAESWLDRTELSEEMRRWIHEPPRAPRGGLAVPPQEG
jgi:hypothetical protein